MFITERALDAWGNRGYTNSQEAVIEVEPYDDRGYVMWRVIAPETFREKWPTLSPRLNWWLTVDGPARLLSESEWKELCAAVENEAPL